MAAPAAVEPEAGTRRDRPDLNNDVVTEILLRLPSVAVLRSRAVCKAWRRIATSPAFLAAHARRRPLELVFQRNGPNGALETIPLDALDESRRRRLTHVRYPERTTRHDRYSWIGYALIASCDGLLLFERGPGERSPGSEVYFVCNPLTSQWTALPCPPGKYTMPCGFYLHRPSGEHRALCLTADEQGSTWHYVCSLEAAGARRLGPMHPVFKTWALRQPLDSLDYRGKLHWKHYPLVMFPEDIPRGPVAVATKEAYKILAFDTVSETFRRISRPPLRREFDETGLFLLESEGMLAMTAILNGSMDLWVLQDYDNDESWTLRLRVDDLTPQLRHGCWAVNAGVEGRNVILLGDSWRCWVGLYDVAEERVLKQIQLADNDRSRVRAFVFKDSLEQHGFF